MAKTDAPQGRDKGGSNILSALVAVVAVGVFIGWLVMQRPAETVAVTETNTAPTSTFAEDSAVTAVTPDELAQTARVRELRGQDVRLDDIEVVSALGTQLFWLQLPNGSPFLAKLDSTLIAAGTAVPGSGRYRIVGRIMEKTDATLAAWQQAGVLRNEGDRMQAEFGSAYIEARRVQPAGS